MQNEKLNADFSQIYQGFLQMDESQMEEFNQSIKFFKHDDVGRHK